MQENPYQAPEADVFQEEKRGRRAPLATLGQRLRGNIVDAVAVGVAAAFAVVALVSLSVLDEFTASIENPGLVIVIWSVAFLAINGHSLASSGQTLGKMICKTQIVSVSDGQVPPLWRILVLRTLPFAAAGLAIVGPFAGLIDALPIFREDRRTLHDHVAGTRVIQYRE